MRSSKSFPESTEEPEDEEATKVSVIGRPNVGKSSLINRLLGYKRVLVDEVPGTTGMPLIRPLKGWENDIS